MKIGFLVMPFISCKFSTINCEIKLHFTGMIMNVCQSLTDNFSKQTLHMQEIIFMPLLSMKMGLFSSYSAGHQKAVDYHTRLVLHAIGNTIKGVLKPRNVSAGDKV